MHVGQVVKQERSVRGYCLEWLWLLYCLATSIVHPSLDSCTLTMNQYCFITLSLFYQILVSSNTLKADRRAFQWLHCVISSGGLTIDYKQKLIEKFKQRDNWLCFFHNNNWLLLKKFKLYWGQIKVLKSIKMYVYCNILVWVFLLCGLLKTVTHFKSDVAFDKVEIKMITNNITNSPKYLSYHFDFYLSEKYMECLLVDFSDYNQWSICWGNPIISDDRLWNLSQIAPLVIGMHR